MSGRKYFHKRRVPRRAFNNKVGLLVDGTYHASRAHQVGEGGMLITSPIPLAKGKKVVVSFQISGIKHLVLQAVVIYQNVPEPGSTELRFGLEFTKIDFEAKRKIRSYVASKSIKEDDEAA